MTFEPSLSSRSKRSHKLAWALAFGALLLLGYGNFAFARRSTGGPDLLNHWVAMREFIFHGESPYSEDTSLKIQQAIYGRPALPGENLYLDVYPLYASLVTFSPFALLGKFTLARAAWMTLLELSLLASTILLWRMMRWKPRPFLAAAMTFFGITWYFAVRALIHGNAIVLVLFWLVVALYALWAKADFWAGMALVMATIKPNVVVLPIAFLLLWAASERRWKLWQGFFLLLGILLAFSLWLLPTWPLENLHNILAYPAYNPPASPQTVLSEAFPTVGKPIGWALIGFSWLLMLLEWKAAWRRDFNHALWTIAVTLLFSIWSGIQTAPGNQLVLWIPLLFAWAQWEIHWKAAGAWAIGPTLPALWGGLWWLFLSTLQHDALGRPLQSPWMYFPMGIFLFIALYGVRKHAIRPVQPRGTKAEESTA